MSRREWEVVIKKKKEKKHCQNVLIKTPKRGLLKYIFKNEMGKNNGQDGDHEMGNGER